MSGGFSLFPEMANGFSAGIDTSTGGTAVSGGTGASNTKGAWVQLTASTPNDATWMMVRIGSDGTVGANINNLLLDIGIGGAGSEIVIAPNLSFNAWSGSSQGETYIFPVAIPAGTRIAARAQSDATSSNGCYAAIMCFDSGYTTPIGAGGLDDVGTNTGNSQLTTVACGTSGAKGSYVQLIASTSRDYAGFLPAFSSHGSFANILVDIAVGGAGSEQIIIPDYYLNETNASTFPGIVSFPFFIQIPAGTRISARAAASTGSAPSTFQAAVYGIYQ